MQENDLHRLLLQKLRNNQNMNYEFLFICLTANYVPSIAVV